MHIAIDISPLQLESGHSVRGVGFYIENLQKTLLKNYPQDTFQFFIKQSDISSDTDIIHIPYFSPFSQAHYFSPKIPTVVTIHDLIPLVFPKDFPPGIKGNVIWHLQKRKVQRLNAILTDSQCSKNDIMRFINIPPDKIHITYLAAGSNFKQQKSEKIYTKYNLPEKFVLYVGDVTINKNLPSLITAVKKIDVPIVLVGKTLAANDYDSHHRENRDLHRVKLLSKGANNIHILGFVPSEDLPFLYSVATVFGFPSRYEGFGLPILEAMSCGTPVVTTRCGSIPEVAGDAAFFVSDTNIDEIAAGIKKVYFNDSLQKELSQKGLVQAAKFTWDETAKQTYAVYKKIKNEK